MLSCRGDSEGSPGGGWCATMPLKPREKYIIALPGAPKELPYRIGGTDRSFGISENDPGQYVNNLQLTRSQRSLVGAIPKDRPAVDGARRWL